jgi:hypothetical protein
MESPRPNPQPPLPVPVTYEQLARIILPLILEQLEREREVRFDGR